MDRNINTGLLILRLNLGILMLFHGIAKLQHGLGGIEGMLTSKDLPGFIAYGAYVGEIIAPLMLVVGFRTRLAALVFALNMIVALFLAHTGDIFTLSPHGGWAVELIGLYIFGVVALLFTGGGGYAISSSNKWD